MGRDEYEYIVIGSGAGGGPVAANLAKVGHRVLVLEAGGDGNNARSSFRYAVPGADPRNDTELGWAYWVRSRAKREDEEKQHFYVPGKGVYYPRGTSIGGSTAVSAMIALYPDNSDWDLIADRTGDSSWSSAAMRTYYERLEGWLSLETVGAKKNLFKDKWLTNYVLARVRNEENGAAFEKAARNGEEFRMDPNDWDFVRRKGTGLVDLPRTAENGTRRGTRELLLATAAQHRNLEIRTDCLVARLLFDDVVANRVVGVEYFEGPHLYSASLLAEQFAGRRGMRREVFASREVILAAGAFNSPQLLMLSGVGPEEELRRHGIPVRVPLPGVGQNLQDRLETGVVCKLPFEPHIYSGCTWGAEGDPCLAELQANVPDAAYRSRLRRQMYMIRKSHPEKSVPDLVIFGTLGAFRGYYHPLRAPASSRDAFTWFTLVGHTQHARGTVTLRSPNPRDTPDIAFNKFDDTAESNADLEALLRGVKMARRMAALGAEGSAEGEVTPGPNCTTDDELREFVKKEAWGHHASCSTKMGPRHDPMAVVDSGFRVHGTERLRVVDASVFPRIPGLFILLSIYMIAEKASDVILADAAR